jgi:hypothetical protein
MALWRNALIDVQAKAGTAYQVKGEDFGKMFTNRGLTASITFTLPPVADVQRGWYVDFYGVSAYGFVVASSGSADNIVALNDADADSITVNTTSRIIGAFVRVIFDGTDWLVIEGAGATYTVA